MVRKCVVNNCTSSDITILSHRFPRNQKLAKQWQENLNVEHISLKDLFLKYVVCTNHFKKSDYRNPISNHINYTAIPTCDDLEEAVLIDPESEYEIVELLEEEVENDEVDEEHSSTENCEEEHLLEYGNVDSEHCDDNNYVNIFPYGSNIQTSTDRETIDLDVEDEVPENNKIQYEGIEMNLIEDNIDETHQAIELINEQSTNQQQNDFVKERPSKKPKLDSPIKIHVTEVTPEVIPEKKQIVIQEVFPEKEKAEEIEIKKATTKNEEKIEKNLKITEQADEISDDEDSDFKKLTRKELIKKIKNQSKKITELEKKVKSYQKKMTVSMKTIKQLMLGNSDDDDDDDFL